MFRKKFKAAFKASGMTQTQLAEITGIPVSSICQYLNGGMNPSPERMEKIKAAFGPVWDKAQDETGEPLLPAASLTVREAATLMGKSVGFVQEGLKAGVFPFGWGVRMPGGKWSYWISRSKFIESTGLKASPTTNN